MKFIQRIATALLLAATAVYAPAFAQSQIGGKQSREQKLSIGRSITIAELGFSEGIQLESPGGVQTFFFPVPRAAGETGGTLSFAYDDAAPREGERSLLVTVGSRTAISRALSVGQDRQVINVPLVSDDFSGNFVKVTVRYSSVVANDHFSVLPETALQLSIATDALSDVPTVATLMPQKMAIGIPERKLSEQEMAGAISAVRLFAARGHQVGAVPLGQLLVQRDARNGVWARGDVIIAAPSDLDGHFPLPNGAKDPGGVAAVVPLADGPGLLFTGNDPQTALNFVGSDWREAGTDSAIRIARVQARARLQDRVTFDQLGVQASASTTANQVILTTNLRATDFPQERWPAALDLDLGIGSDGNATAAVANAYMNGRFLAGTVASQSGITRLHAVIPRGLVGLENQIRIVVQRLPRAIDGVDQPAPLSAQLLGSSSIALRVAQSSAHDFFALAPHASNRLTVFVRDNISVEEQRAAIQALGLSAINFTQPGTPIVVRRLPSGRIPDSSSTFLAWGNFDFDGKAVPVRFDRGNVSVRTRSGVPLFDLQDARNTLVAQIVTLGGAPSGLWLHSTHPAAAIEAPQSIVLDRGNVAFIGPSGVALAFSTERSQLVDVTYADAPAWQVRARRYGIGLLLAFWIALSIAVLMALKRFYRQRHGDREESQ